MATAVSIQLVPSIGNAYDDTDLYHVWTLDETSGVCADSISTADLTDNNTVLYGAGINNNGADFENGSSEYLSTATFDDIAPFSFSFWVNFESLGTNNGDYRTLFRVADQSEGRSIGLRHLVYNSVDNWNLICDADDFIAHDITTATWYFIVVTYDGFECKLYVDASLKKTLTDVSTTVSADKMTIGGDFNPNGGAMNSYYLDGIVDEFYIWDHQLATSSIESLYNSGTGDFYSFGGTATTSTTSTSTTTTDVSELIWVMELYLSMMLFLIFTYIGYRFTKLFI